MYLLKNDRRITQFIKKEACEWLRNNINKYIFQGTEAEKLFTEVVNHGMTEARYLKFLDIFENNPVSRKVKGLSPGKKTIVSDDIYMYFINYNNFSLPIGFITEFFEDDYEDKNNEIKLINDFLDYSKNNAKMVWEGQKFELTRIITDKKKTLENINKCKIKIYVKYFVSLALFIVLINFFVQFWTTSKIWDVVVKEFLFERERSLTVHVPAFNLGADEDAKNTYEKLGPYYEAYMKSIDDRDEETINAWDPSLTDYYSAQNPRFIDDYNRSLKAEETYKSAEDKFKTEWHKFLNEYKLDEQLDYIEYGMNLSYTIGEYLVKFGVSWFYLIVLFYIIFKISPFTKVSITKETIYLIRTTNAKIKIFFHERISKKCRDTGGEQLEYLSDDLIKDYEDQPNDISKVKPNPEVIRMFAKLNKYNSKSDDYDRYNAKAISSFKVKNMVNLIIMNIFCFVVNMQIVKEFVLNRIEQFIG